MSDSLEKFVLQYTVDLKESINRLEQLQDKVDQTNKKAKSAGKDFTGAFKDVFGELKPLTAELGSIDGILARLTYRFAALVPVVAGLAVVVKSIVDVRKEYEAQRKLGFEAGLSPIGVEQLQRQLNESSGGVLGAQGSRDLISKASNLAFNAYTNPDVMNKDNLLLNKMGTSPFNSNGGIKDTNQLLDEIGTKLRSVNEQTARAIGALAGFTADEVRALRERNQSVKESTRISDEETAKLQRQQAALETIRNSMGQIQEDWRRIELVIGENVMPAFSTLVSKTADTVEGFQMMFQRMSDGWSEFVDNFIADLKHPFDKQAAINERHERAVDRWITQMADGDVKRQRNQEQNAAEQRSAQALFTRDINLFSSAVSTFAGVIDERQAWAAWAGEIGRSAGQSAMPGTPALSTGATVGNNFGSGNPTAYDSIYEEASKRYGIPVAMMKAVTEVESGFNPNAVSGAGATGLMQIMPSNFKGLGITDGNDPRQNIMGGAQLLKEYLTAANGDWNLALTMYHGGYDRSGWGKNTRAYPGKVMAALERQANGEYATGAPQGAPVTPVLSGSGVEAPKGSYAPVQGQSRQTVQYRQLQEAIAGYLNVPVEQLMQGQVNKGDIDFAQTYLKLGTQRDYIKNMQLASTPGVRPNIQAEAMKNARLAAFQLEAFQKYGGDLSANSRPGGRDITMGQKNVVINVNGAQDPRSTAIETKRVLEQDDINDINNLTATPLKW